MKSPITVEPPSRTELLTLRLMIFLGLGAMLIFLKTVLSPQIRGDKALYYLLLVTFLYTCLKILHEWIHYFYITVPDTPVPTRVYTVDIFTTFVAGEPVSMIEETLRALQAVKYPHTTYLCDESNDPNLRAFCEKLGVYHVTRIEKTDAKAGNINNALLRSNGELCVVLDPDHVPFPEFLDPIVPHFDNQEIGFVQIVQAYKNHKESLIAKGAAQQTYQFYGPMMMTMNKYGTVQAIGANCTFRRSALESIGGHAAGLAEDMHTSMRLHAKGWKSVYVPVVLTRGLVPSSLSAYYQQQLKWSRGVFDLFLTVYPKLFTQFTWRQKLHYAAIPLHYASGLIFLINFLIPLFALFFNKSPVYMSLSDFGLVALPFIAAIVMIRHFVQWWVMEDEERGFHIVGGLLMIGTWWVFMTGLIYTVLRKKVPYVPTPKEGTGDSRWLLNIPNFIILVLSIAAIFYGLLNDWNPYNLAMAGFAATNCFVMIFVIGASRQQQLRRWKSGGSFASNIFSQIDHIKGAFWIFRRRLYTVVRKMALVITAVGVASLAYLKNGDFDSEHIEDQEKASQSNTTDLRFKIAQLTFRWGQIDQFNSIFARADSVYASGSIPMISWIMSANEETLSSILDGEYDRYLRSVSDQIRAVKRPVYVGLFGGEAGRYVCDFFKNRQIYNVIYLSNTHVPIKEKGLKTEAPRILLAEPFVENEDITRPVFGGLYGVNYSKGQEWAKKLKVFTKEELEADVAEMKSMHVNAIKRYGSGIYDRNVLKVARKNALQVHYGFWIAENIDFQKDRHILDELTDKILTTVDYLKDHDEICSWNVGNAVFQKLEYRYQGPELLYQQQACLLWLKETILKIKKTDPVRPVTIDVNTSGDMAFEVKRIFNFIPQIDAFGLVVGDHVPTARDLTELHVPYFISYVAPGNQRFLPIRDALFLSNWQDEKWTDKVSMDGVKDFDGRYKSPDVRLAIKVLKPAAGTFEGTELTYHAIVRKNGRWKLANSAGRGLQYEWKLVKTDRYANPLMVTDVGVGPHLVLKIPDNPSYYRLHLYAIQGDSVKAIIQSTLNTPLAIK